jgi:hypothetical protein
MVTSRRFRSLLLLGLVGGLGVGSFFLLEARQSRSAFENTIEGGSDVAITISSADAVVATDRYFTLAIDVVNNGDGGVPLAIGNCAQQLEVWVNGDRRVKSSGARCAIGFEDLPPGASRSTTKTFDLSELSPGTHEVQIALSGIKSNKLELNVNAPEDSPSDCYNYTERLTSFCGNVLIHSNVYSDASENDALCSKIKARFVDGTALNPIASLSTIDCDDGRKAYFVANVPWDDVAQWRSQLKAAGDFAGIFTADTQVIYPKL